jgi:hypothetical protein
MTQAGIANQKENHDRHSSKLDLLQFAAFVLTIARALSVFPHLTHRQSLHNKFEIRRWFHLKIHVSFLFTLKSNITAGQVTYIYRNLIFLRRLGVPVYISDFRGKLFTYIYERMELLPLLQRLTSWVAMDFPER